MERKAPRMRISGRFGGVIPDAREAERWSPFADST
jgi:hypothetical protein